jgi:hypothetical protein
MFPIKSLLFHLNAPTCSANITRGSVQASFSLWSKLPLAPPDKILGLNEAYKQDNYPQKVNLGVGAYRDENGRPLKLESVKIAEKTIASANLDHEYSSIAGLPSFIDQAIKFAYGKDSPIIPNIAGVQSLSGTGACRLFAEFIAKLFGRNKKVYLPDPTVGFIFFGLFCALNVSFLVGQSYRNYEASRIRSSQLSLLQRYHQILGFLRMVGRRAISRKWIRFSDSCLCS